MGTSQASLGGDRTGAWRQAGSSLSLSEQHEQAGLLNRQADYQEKNFSGTLLLDRQDRHLQRQDGRVDGLA